MNSNKSYIALLSVSVLCLVVIISSVTYAYFKARIDGEGAPLNIAAGKVGLKISENTINVNNILPIYDKDKDTDAQSNTFTVTRTEDSNLDACYSLYLVVDEIGSALENSEYFKIELDDGKSTPVEMNFGEVKKTQENIEKAEDGTITIPLLSNQSLSEASPTNSYTLRVWLSYVDDVDQTDILNGEPETRKFTAHLKASGQNGVCKDV